MRWVLRERAEGEARAERERERSESNKSGLNSANPFINPRGGIGFKAAPVEGGPAPT